MSYNNDNIKEAENYFEDFDAAPIDDDAPYDDDETFGDTGPLNDEWENQHNLLSEEHESYLSQNRFRKEPKEYENEGINGEEEEEEEEEEDYISYRQSRFANGGGRDVRHFTQSATTTTTTTTTSSRVVINNNNIENDDDSHAQLDDQIESVLQVVMDDVSNNKKQDNQLNKMIELIGSVSIGSNNNTADLSGNKGMSLSDIEAKLFEQQQQAALSENTSSSTTTTTTTTAATAAVAPTASPTTTPNKTTKNNNNNNNNNSPHRQPNQNVHNRYPRPLTLGDMIGGKQQNQNYQQQQQQQQQSTSSPRKYINKNQTKNSGDKKYMTAEEIQTINRLQAYQIHFTNPFIEDYYYQRYKIKQSGPTHSHTPICDSTPKTAPSPKKPNGNTDPLTGALGRIPSHSIRAPRQILQVILDSNEDGSGNADGEKNQNSDPTIKLVIESAYNHILDLEDIKELIANTTDVNLLAEYQTKEEPVARELFKSLYLDPFPSFKFESPTLPTQEPNQKWPSVCHEDLLFVSLWVFAKGRKLLKRAFPLLNDKQSLSGLFAVCRNLPLLLLLHLPEGSEQSTEAIYKVVCKWIMEVPIKFFILGFHFLVNFNQSKFIVKLFQTKEGLSVIQSFLNRGFLIYDQMYLSQNQLTLDPMDHEQWRDVFDRFFQRITGNFQTIFPMTQQPSIELSQIFQSLMGHCNEQQTMTFHMELSAGQQPPMIHNQQQQQFHPHPQQQQFQQQQQQPQFQQPPPQMMHHQQQFPHPQQQFQQFPQQQPPPPQFQHPHPQQQQQFQHHQMNR